MTAMLPLGLLAGCAVGGGVGGPAVAPPPREKPALRCEVRWTGKVTTTFGGERMSWNVPDAAEVVITNTSDADVDIGSRFLPEGLLDFRTKGPAGVPVKTEPYRYSLTPYSPTHEPYILKPGESYRIYAGLLRTVPAEKRVAGTYKVKAVYTVKGKEYTSAEVEVKWPGNKE